jgi:hypothetical protein
VGRGKKVTVEFLKCREFGRFVIIKQQKSHLSGGLSVYANE